VKSFPKIIVALALFAPAKMFACAACYANGANINDAMANGMNWAILTLGVVVATVLGAFLTFFIHIFRKSEAVEAARNQVGAARPTTLNPLPDVPNQELKTETPKFA
jgi:hypothetical protein